MSAKHSIISTVCRSLIFACLAFLPTLASAQTSVAPTTGDGSSATPYQMTSLQNLAWLQEQTTTSGATSGKYYALANNIDATSTSLSTYDSGSGFLPIGTYSLPFQGTFLGNGHTISNLSITRPSLEQVGLFGAVESGTLQDLSLTGVAITGRNYVGGLVGTLKANTALYNCSVSGTVSGETSIGGLVGESALSYASIIQCSAAVNVTGSSENVGGLIGYLCIASGGGTQTISQCSSTGAVSGSKYVGGLIGYAWNYSTQTISQCYATGTVTGSGESVGGLVGYAYNFATQTISQCYATGAVSGNGNYVGGLVGQANNSAEQTISQCYAVGVVTGTSSFVGGLVGYAYNYLGTQEISQCYATGKVSGGMNIGGLVGRTTMNYDYGTQTILLCSASGDVSGTINVGGLVGLAENDGTQTLSQCYATGSVSGTSNVGGLVGKANNFGTQTFSNCYCLNGGYGAVSGGDQSGVSVVSASALRTQSTYSGWDFPDDWVIDTTQGLNDGYPYLRCFSALVYSLNINDGATSTTSRAVTLIPVMTPFVTHYAVSENADFSDASWIALDEATTMTYTLSSGPGEKTLYFCAYNDNNTYHAADDGGSEITTATITLVGVAPTVTAFRINSSAASTNATAVTITNTATGDPTYYRVSESASGVDTATAQTYSSSGSFTLSSGNGTKTVYFKVGNETGESNVMSASISLKAADMAFVKNSVVVQSTHTESYAKKTGITSKDTYAFKASVQLPGTFASISASTQINITVGDVTFSDTISNAVSKSLKGAKGGSAVFRTQVLVGKTKKTTQIITLTWSKTGLLKVVVTGTPIAGTGSAVTTNILNALSVDDGTIAANVPIEVGVGTDYARNATGVVCAGTRSTTAVKGTAVNLNKWIMTGKK